MIYPIYIYGSPVLRRETKEIESNSDELQQLIADMFETMYAADGVGLAAPQIGKSLRLAVIDTTPLAKDNPELETFKKVMINPEIYEAGEEEVIMEEGCLSLPGINEDVSRPDSIRIRYLDENFVEHDEEYIGYGARVFQHEYDHLFATFFTDRVTPLRKTLIRNKLAGMAKGKFEAHYRTRQTTR